MSNDLTTKLPIGDLIIKIKDEIILSKQKMEIEKTIAYWKIGKHIKEHLLENQDRADYGEYVYKTIAEELAISTRVLYFTVQFYEMYPKIVNTYSQLTWSHYKLLLAVKDDEKRKEFEQQVIKEDLSVRELKELIKEEKSNGNINNKQILIVKRGLLHIFKLKTLQMDKTTKLYIDLGFKIYKDNPDKGNASYAEESIVRVKESMNDYSFTLINEDQGSKLYTYKGYIKEIVDGDTIWVILELGFNTWTTKKIRLRGINAMPPEMLPGKKAKEFISSQLNPCNFVVIKTYWRDKYNRYLADISLRVYALKVFKVHTPVK
ncbi:MAG: hypothetical protein JXJ04_19795 [Spirochaetales bacterium]|nr:hypothetical protein [Spirochaetales bacterium]